MWNRAIDGFGNKDPGRRRATQYKSPWDVLHPGRAFSVKLADSPVTPELLKRIADYLVGRPLDKLPKVLEEQKAAEEAEAEESLPTKSNLFAAGRWPIDGSAQSNRRFVSSPYSLGQP